MTTAATPFNEDMPKLKASELETMIGKEVGVSKWIVIDQKKIDTFAELTHDTYFIHTDPVRAKKETPFGGPIAHGFLPAERLRL
jgi:acyl dehydratase